MGIRKIIDYIFGYEKPVPAAAPPPPQLPESFKNQYNDPNPEVLDFNPSEIKILWDWQPGFEFNGKGYSKAVGENGDTLIFVSADLSLPRQWEPCCSIEKKNLPALISLLEDALKSRMNFSSNESILDSAPDAIKISFSSDRFGSSNIIIANMRDIVINGERPSYGWGLSVSFSDLLLKEFIKGLKSILPPEQDAAANQ